MPEYVAREQFDELFQFAGLAVSGVQAAQLNQTILALALNRIMLAMLNGRRVVWPEISEAAEEFLQGLATDAENGPQIAEARKMLGILGAGLAFA